MSHLKQIRNLLFRSLQVQVKTKRAALVAVLATPGASVLEPAVDEILVDFASNASQALMFVGELTQAADDWATADRLADQKADDLAGLERIRKMMFEYAADRPGTSLAAREVEKIDGEIDTAARALAEACALESQRDSELRQLARQIARRMES